MTNGRLFDNDDVAYNNCTSFYSEYSGNDEADQYNFAYDYNEDGYPRQVNCNLSNISGNFDGTITTTIDINYY